MMQIKSARPAVELLVLGLSPWFTFHLLHLTGLSAAVSTLTSVRSPGELELVLAVVTEVSWLLSRIMTPICLVASVLVLLFMSAATSGRPGGTTM